eukprot:scaffold396_cov339-Prasinococcus_capsulatus_cf.AAC.9
MAALSSLATFCIWPLAKRAAETPSAVRPGRGSAERHCATRCVLSTNNETTSSTPGAAASAALKRPRRWVIPGTWNVLAEEVRDGTEGGVGERKQREGALQVPQQRRVVVRARRQLLLREA